MMPSAKRLLQVLDRIALVQGAERRRDRRAGSRSPCRSHDSARSCARTKSDRAARPATARRRERQAADAQHAIGSCHVTRRASRRSRARSSASSVRRSGSIAPLGSPDPIEVVAALRLRARPQTRCRSRRTAGSSARWPFVELQSRQALREQSAESATCRPACAARRVEADVLRDARQFRAGEPVDLGDGGAAAASSCATRCRWRRACPALAVHGICLRFNVAIVRSAVELPQAPRDCAARCGARSAARSRRSSRGASACARRSRS